MKSPKKGNLCKSVKKKKKNGLLRKKKAFEKEKKKYAVSMLKRIQAFCKTAMR